MEEKIEKLEEIHKKLRLAVCRNDVVGFKDLILKHPNLISAFDFCIYDVIVWHDRFHMLELLPRLDRKIIIWPWLINAGSETL